MTAAELDGQLRPCDALVEMREADASPETQAFLCQRWATELAEAAEIGVATPAEGEPSCKAPRTEPPTPFPEPPSEPHWKFELKADDTWRLESGPGALPVTWPQESCWELGASHSGVPAHAGVRCAMCDKALVGTGLTNGSGAFVQLRCPRPGLAGTHSPSHPPPWDEDASCTIQESDNGIVFALGAADGDDVVVLAGPTRVVQYVLRP